MKIIGKRFLIIGVRRKCKRKSNVIVILTNQVVQTHKNNIVDYHTAETTTVTAME